MIRATIENAGGISPETRQSQYKRDLHQKLIASVTVSDHVVMESGVHGIITSVKDRKAIYQILALDPRGLYETVMNESISMCGFGPAVAMLTAVKRL